MQVSYRGAALLAVGLLIFPAAHAADPALTVTFGSSQQFFDNEYDVDDDRALIGGAEFRITDEWSAEFLFATGETGDDEGYNVDIDRWRLNAMRYIAPREDLHPYVSFGLGQVKHDWDLPSGSRNYTNEEANIAVGAHLFVNQYLSIRGDAGYMYGFDENTSDLSLAVGLSWHFGGAPARSGPRVAATRPAPTPAPAPTPQRLDSDGDGVYDDRDQCPGTPAGARVDSRGCEIKSTRIASIRLLVNFDFDKDEVQERYFTDIGELADFLRRFDDVDIDIEGHTDSVGSDGYNQALSERRARSVVEMLVNEHGISRDRIRARGYGESQPVADNETSEGRARNRRVVADLEVQYEE